jgi:hypothetical protein
MHFAIGDTRYFADLLFIEQKTEDLKVDEILQTYYLVGSGLFSVAGVRARGCVVWQSPTTAQSYK